MPGTVAVTVPTLDELAPAVRRCAEPDAADGHPALLVDAELQAAELPREPGLYVWSDPQGAVLYIGRAAGETRDLAIRVGEELSLVEGYDPVGDRWEVSVVHMLHVHQARPRWARASSAEAAKEAERRLIEWHRALVGIAPVAVGWDVAAGSHQGRAQEWAHALWDETIAGSPADQRSH